MLCRAVVELASRRRTSIFRASSVLVEVAIVSAAGPRSSAYPAGVWQEALSSPIESVAEIAEFRVPGCLQVKLRPFQVTINRENSRASRLRATRPHSLGSLPSPAITLNSFLLLVVEVVKQPSTDLAGAVKMSCLFASSTI